MELIKLVVTGVNLEDTISINFVDGSTLKKSEIEEVKNSFTKTLFGDESTNTGVYKLDFIENGQKLQLIRDFDNKIVTITNNDDIVFEGTEADKYINESLKLSKESINNFAFFESNTLMDNVSNDVENFAKDQLNILKIDTNMINEARDSYKNEILVDDIKIDVIENKKVKDKDFNKTKKTLEESISEKSEELILLSEKLSISKLIDATREKINVLNGNLVELKNKEEDILIKKEKVEKSKFAKKNLDLINAFDNLTKGNSNNDADKYDSEIDTAKKELEINENILKNKEEELRVCIKTINNYNATLDKIIADNKEGKKLNGAIYARIINATTEFRELTKKLDGVDKEIKKQIKKLDSDISKLEDELYEITLSSEYRMQIRESACFEAKIATMQDEEKILNNTLKNDEATISLLEERKEALKKVMEDSKEEYIALFGEQGQKSLERILSDINKREGIKDVVFKDEITASLILQDINSIEQKVAENEDVRENCKADLANLINARETLIKYRERTANQIENTKTKMAEIDGYIHFFDEAEGMEYGSRCPVCSSVVASKPNINIKRNNSLAEYEELKKKYDKFLEQDNKYAEKLNELNERIGNDTSNVNVLTGYIFNLNKAKRTKLAQVQAIYKKNGVRNQTELIKKLEECTKQSMLDNKMLTDIKAVSEKEKIAKEEYEIISNYLESFSSQGYSDRKIGLVNVRNQIINLRYGLSKVNTLLRGEEAVSKLDAMNKIEKREEKVRGVLKSLYDNRTELYNKLLESSKNRVILEGKEEYAISYKDNKYTYGALCVAITSEAYEELIADIRIEEANKSKLQEEYLTANNLVFESREKLQKLLDEKNIAIGNSVNNVSFDANLKTTSGEDYLEMKNQILIEELEVEYEKEINEFYEKLNYYTYQIKACEEIIETNKLEETTEDIELKRKDIQNKLESDRALLNETDLVITNNKDFDDDVKQIKKNKSNLEKAYSNVNKINEDGDISKLFVEKINDYLLELNSPVKGKLEEKKLIFIRNAHGVDETNVKFSVQEKTSILVSIVAAKKEIGQDIIKVKNIPCFVEIESNINDQYKENIRKFAQNNGISILFY